MAPSTKATQKRLEAALTSFNARYSSPQQWGDRWFDSLYPALAQPTTYGAVINQYAISPNEGGKILSESAADNLELLQMPQDGNVSSQQVVCYLKKPSHKSDVESRRSSSTTPFPPPRPSPHSDNPLLTHWNMDAASVLAANMLDVCSGDKVLDMCAAPGGKSVVLAQTLFAYLRQSPHDRSPVPEDIEKMCLHVNELDAARYRRLSANLKAYLPASLFPTAENPQAPIKMLNKDLSSKSAVSSLPLGESAYDKILIDSPCSSERHIIHAHEKAHMASQVANEMLNWKGSHVSTLVRIQVGLLHTALKAVKVGGRIVYATCALGTEENDRVIEKVLETLKTDRKKAKRDGFRGEEWEVHFLAGNEGGGSYSNDHILERMTECTKYGRIALPDHGGWGPLFFSIMTKTRRESKRDRNLGAKLLADDNNLKEPVSKHEMLERSPSLQSGQSAEVK